MLSLSAVTVVHPAGHDSTSLWDSVVQARSGLQKNKLDWCDLACWLGAVPGVDDVRLPAQLEVWDSRNHRLAWLALQEKTFRSAVASAVARHGSHRIGVVLGTSTSGVRQTEVAYAQRHGTGHWPANFHYRQSHSVDSLCRFTAEVLKLQGPMTVISTACSSSAKVFLTAQRWIDAGLIDAAVVGGADSLCLSTLHGFDALQLLSENICCPFDAARNGLSIGEAAGFVLLDRNPAPVHFAGGGESSDAWHMSTPHPEGQGAKDAMHEALLAAWIQPSDVGYVNAHGTATPANDRSEAAAISSFFGTHRVPISSTKGITGHTLGAAGIVEAIVTAQALERQVLPPIANLVTPDPTFTLNLVREAHPAFFKYAMSNNFGFGGSNCSLIFGKTD